MKKLNLNNTVILVLVMVMTGLWGCVENAYGQRWTFDTNTNRWYIVNKEYTHGTAVDGNNVFLDSLYFPPLNYSVSYECWVTEWATNSVEITFKEGNNTWNSVTTGTRGQSTTHVKGTTTSVTNTQSRTSPLTVTWDGGGAITGNQKTKMSKVSILVPAHIDLNTTELDFGEVEIGETKTMSIAFKSFMNYSNNLSNGDGKLRMQLVSPTQTNTIFPYDTTLYNQFVSTGIVLCDNNQAYSPYNKTGGVTWSNPDVLNIQVNPKAMPASGGPVTETIKIFFIDGTGQEVSKTVQVKFTVKPKTPTINWKRTDIVKGTNYNFSDIVEVLDLGLNGSFAIVETDENGNPVTSNAKLTIGPQTITTNGSANAGDHTFIKATFTPVAGTIFGTSSAVTQLDISQHQLIPREVTWNADFTGFRDDYQGGPIDLTSSPWNLTTSDGGGTISYSVPTNQNIATINTSNGGYELNLNGNIGSTTITATVEADGTYQRISITKPLVVSDHNGCSYYMVDYKSLDRTSDATFSFDGAPAEVEWAVNTTLRPTGTVYLKDDQGHIIDKFELTDNEDSYTNTIAIQPQYQSTRSFEVTGLKASTSLSWTTITLTWFRVKMATSFEEPSEKSIDFGEAVIANQTNKLIDIATYSNIPGDISLEIVDVEENSTNTSSCFTFQGNKKNTIISTGKCGANGNAKTSVNFVPTIEGTHKARIKVTVNDGLSATNREYYIILTGEGTKLPQQVVWNTSHDFYEGKDDSFNAKSNSVNLSGLATSNIPDITQEITYEVVDGDVAEVTTDGNGVKWLVFKKAGTTKLKATLGGTDIYRAVSDELEFNVSRAIPTITWNNTQTAGFDVFDSNGNYTTVQLLADFSEGSTHKFEVAEGYTDRGSIVNDTYLQFRKADVDIEVNAIVEEDEVYAEKSVSETFQAKKVTPTLTWNTTSMGTKTYKTGDTIKVSDLLTQRYNSGDAAQFLPDSITLSAKNASGEEMFAVVTSGNINNAKVRVIKAGAISSLTASTGEVENYFEATSSKKSSSCGEFGKGKPTITWSPTETSFAVGNDILQEAIASFGLGNDGITYTSSNTNVVDNTLHCAAPGLVKITATRAEDDDYLAADPVSRVFTVNPDPFNYTVDDEIEPQSFIISDQICSGGFTISTIGDDSKYELCLLEGGHYSNSVTVGSTPATIWVKLKSTATAYEGSETITIASASCGNYQMTVSGKVSKISGQIFVPSSALTYYSNDYVDHLLVGNEVYGNPVSMNEYITLSVGAQYSNYIEIIDGQSIRILSENITEDVNNITVTASIRENDRIETAESKTFNINIKYVEITPESHLVWEKNGNDWYVLNTVGDAEVQISQYNYRNIDIDVLYEVYLPNEDCSGTFDVEYTGQASNRKYFAALQQSQNGTDFEDADDSFQPGGTAPNTWYTINCTTTIHSTEAILRPRITDHNRNNNPKYARNIELKVPQHYDVKGGSRNVPFPDTQIGEVSYMDVPLADMFKSFLTTRGLNIVKSSGDNAIFVDVPNTTPNLIPANEVFSPYNKLSGNNGLIQDSYGNHYLRIYFKPEEVKTFNATFVLQDNNDTKFTITVSGKGITSEVEPQTIVWNQDLSQLVRTAYGQTATIGLTATSSSGLPITYSLTNRTTNSISLNSNTKQLTYSNTAGTANLTAVSAEDIKNGVTYSATSMVKNVVVSQQAATIERCVIEAKETPWEKGDLSRVGQNRYYLYNYNNNNYYTYTSSEVPDTMKITITYQSFRSYQTTTNLNYTFEVYANGTNTTNQIHTETFSCNTTTQQTKVITIDLTKLSGTKKIQQNSRIYCRWLSSSNSQNQGYNITKVEFFEQPTLTPSTASVDFGTQRVGQAGMTKQAVVNYSNTSGAIWAEIDGTDKECFSIVSQNPVTAECEGNAAAFDVKFIPTKSGNLAAQLKVHGPYSNQTATIPLTGTATKRDLKVNWDYADVERHIDAVGNDTTLNLDPSNDNAFAHDKLRTVVAKTSCPVDYTILLGPDVERLSNDADKQDVIKITKDANGKITKIQATGYGSGTVYIIASVPAANLTGNTLFNEITDVIDRDTLVVKVNKVTPTITVEGIPTEMTYLDPDSTITIAHALMDETDIKDIGNNVIYSLGGQYGRLTLVSSDENIVEILNYNTLHVKEVGPVSITAKVIDQNGNDGDAISNPATSQEYQLEIKKKARTIKCSDSNPATITYNDNTKSVTATTELDDKAITYSIISGSDCADINSSTGVITTKKVGKVQVEASIPESQHYLAAKCTCEVDIVKANPTLTANPNSLSLQYPSDLANGKDVTITVTNYDGGTNFSFVDNDNVEISATSTPDIFNVKPKEKAVTNETLTFKYSSDNYNEGSVDVPVSVSWDDMDLQLDDTKLPQLTSTDVVDLKTLTGFVKSINYTNNVTLTYEIDNANPADMATINDGVLTISKKGTLDIKVTATHTLSGKYATESVTCTVSKGTLKFIVAGKWTDAEKWSRPDIVRSYTDNQIYDYSDYNVLIADSCFIGKDEEEVIDETTFLEHTVNAACHDLSFADNANAKLVIGEASTLNVAGNLTNNDADKLLLTANYWGQASVVFGNNGEEHPNPQATVEMFIPGGNGSSIDPVWQYRGICVEHFSPITEVPLVDADGNPIEGKTINPWSYVYVFEWDESKNDDKNQGCWVNGWKGSDISNDTLEPWKGYCFANMIPVKDSALWLTYTGTLINSGKDTTLSYEYHTYDDGNGGQVSFANVGVNLITNSYAAPLLISKLNYSNVDCDKGIILYNAGSHAQWKQGINVGNQRGQAGQFSTVPRSTGEQATDIITIPAGQSFFVQATAANATLTLPYSTAISISPSTRMYLPGKEIEPEYNMLKIRVTAKSDSAQDYVALLECETCTRQYDNGYDGKKRFGDSGLPQIYAYNKFGNTAVNADSTLNKQYVGFMAGSDDETYTISFETDKLFGYHSLFLTDRKLNETVDILAGETYQFKGYTVGENMRFQINGITEQEWNNDDDNDDDDDDDSNVCDLRVVGNTLYVQGFTTDHYPAARIELFDMTGSSVWSTPLTSERLYDLPSLPQGIYTIRLGDCHVKYSSLK